MLTEPPLVEANGFSPAKLEYPQPTLPTSPDSEPCVDSGLDGGADVLAPCQLLLLRLVVAGGRSNEFDEDDAGF